jgi:hypothetical protein
MYNPRSILDLPDEFDMETLRKQFKKKVMITHPDMNSSEISSSSNFQILVTCYKILLKELEVKEVEKSFDTLKKECNEHYKSNANSTNQNIKPNKFNIELFNEVFNDTKIEDPYEKGYDDWIKKDIDSNNKIKKNDCLVKYAEPVGEVSSTLEGYLLGVDKIENFSANNMNDKDLNYMDYRIAYTTPTVEDQLNEKHIKIRKDYESFDHLKKEREHISFQMNEKDIKKNALLKKKEDEKEQKRLHNLKMRDNLIGKQYENNNGMFINWNKD